MRLKAEINVRQVTNDLRKDGGKTEIQKAYIVYKVVSSKNTIQHPVGATLVASQVDSLIHGGTTVNIR